MQTVVLSIFEVSEHDNQPELEHELLPQYVIDTGEHDGTVCFFRNDILQYETATQNIRLTRTKPVATKKLVSSYTQFSCLARMPVTQPYVGGTQKNWAYRQHDTPYSCWGGMRDNFGRLGIVVINFYVI